MNPFTTEEMNLVCLYDFGNCEGTIYEMSDMLHYLMPDETELRQLAESAIDKLVAMSDAAFYALAEYSLPFLADE